MGSNTLTPMGDCSLAEGQHPVESAGLNLPPFTDTVGSANPLRRQDYRRSR